MTKHVKNPTELEDKALDAVHGGGMDGIKYLVSVTQMTTMDTSSRTPAPAPAKT